MLLGPNFGTLLVSISYETPFLSNGVMLISLGIVSLVIFPKDTIVQSNTIKDKQLASITAGSLLKQYRVLGIACCTACALFAFTFKESILET